MNIFEAAHRGYKHKNLIFWIGMLRSLAAPVGPADRVLDFGCGHGLFLRLLYDFYPYAEGVGVDLDLESINYARASLPERNVSLPIRYLHSEEFDVSSSLGEFDHIFCQEILWMNEDILALAKKLYGLLKLGGRCYCTIGSHPGNPLWEFRRQQMEAAGRRANTWTIDQVAEAFSQVGFAVGVRRLPIEGFLMYDSVSTPANSRSLYELVQTTSECKMLFYFGKHEPVERPTRLQG